ncbi:hypothetical protein FLJC2902T_22650 [Flavobacterium limnosediminis JC2902]|uniref:Uncharacterized protein n=1 Tax=Flavobacterium limnosediminis JC2902 TaxID=1341181 RepID=V6SLE6_9FLAO|nr:hypothetical protein FLJC2902T_22650 [Flavobacterium limnosediminis JC2902]
MLFLKFWQRKEYCFIFPITNFGDIASLNLVNFYFFLIGLKTQTCFKNHLY